MMEPEHIENITEEKPLVGVRCDSVLCLHVEDKMLASDFILLHFIIFLVVGGFRGHHDQ